MEPLKQVGLYLTLACASILLTLALLFSGARLWANVVMVQTGDAVRASHVAPFDRTMLFMASVVQMRKENCKEVVKTLQATLQLYPHYWDAANNLAICYVTIGKIDEAQTLWEQILVEWPYHEAARKNLKEISKAPLRSKR